MVYFKILATIRESLSQKVLDFEVCDAVYKREYNSFLHQSNLLETDFRYYCYRLCNQVLCFRKLYSQE